MSSLGPSMREIENDHVAVREMGWQIRDELSEQRMSPEALAVLLETFRGRIETHFALEESRWSGDRSRNDDRTTTNWVRGLVREHREIERRLAEVLARLNSEKDSRRTPSDAVAAALRTLIDDLCTHELSETKLFQRRIFEGA